MYRRPSFLSNRYTVMARLKIDLAGVYSRAAERIKTGGKDITREVANVVSTVMHERIFEHGLAADNDRIGEYQSNYLKLRVSKYKRSSRIDVIVSLTRKLENAFGVVESKDGYGIGVINQTDADKMYYVETHFARTIAALTDKENKLATEAAAQAADRILNGE